MGNSRKKERKRNIIGEIHSAPDFETFARLTREYVATLGCTVNEKELEMLGKMKEKRGIFYCPCVVFREEMIEAYRCPCSGSPEGPNKGHLADIEEKGSCYCKLYVKNEEQPAGEDVAKKQPEGLDEEFKKIFKRWMKEGHPDAQDDKLDKLATTYLRFVRGLAKLKFETARKILDEIVGMPTAMMIAEMERYGDDPEG